ncbi:MAG TPA: hypothetical protein PK555_12130, partial [Steroidobacteraceae bacterium]|nr:hypothetical protein [Steroidobacteraceae bacterium]
MPLILFDPAHCRWNAGVASFPWGHKERSGCWLRRSKNRLGGKMKLHSKRAAAALLTGMMVVSLPAYAISCLIFPLSCLKPHKKFGEELDAVVLDLNSVKTEHLEVNCYSGYGSSDGCGAVHQGWSALNNSQDFYVWFKVGDTFFEGWHQNTGLVATMVGYKPTRAEWIGKTFKMRFYDEKFLGISGVGAIFKRPNGDDWRLTIVQIYGPDGVPECKYGVHVCPPQAKID